MTRLWGMDAKRQHGVHTTWGQTAWVPVLVLPSTRCVPLGKCLSPSVSHLPDVKAVMIMRFSLTGFFSED